jgi:branched-chain amino acid transport system permease protein
VIFFLIETWFGALGVWYLIGLGATAMIFALFLPRGIWGSLEDRFGIRLLPVGYRLKWAKDSNLTGAPGASSSDRHSVVPDASEPLPDI